MHNSERMAFIKDEIFVIDRLHVKGHIEECKKNYHPSLYSDLSPVNTMVCEQRNFWISAFKYMVKHMNQSRFIFFFYIIFSKSNEITLQGKIKIINEVAFISDQVKRKFAKLYEFSEDEIDEQQNKK